jgi:phage pi2 protein 07
MPDGQNYYVFARVKNIFGFERVRDVKKVGNLAQGKAFIAQHPELVDVDVRCGGLVIYPKNKIDRIALRQAQERALPRV